MAANVSIVIPVWDSHTQLLPRCLQAIRNEPVAVELIVVDNASTVPLAGLPPNARCVRLSERQSIGAARNAALAVVNTPFIVFADADDEVAPGSLAHSLTLLQHDPHAAGVLGRSLVEEHGHYRRGLRPTTAFRLACTYTPALAPLFWLAGYQCSITSTLLHTATVHDAGGFADADIGEDWHLAARMARRQRFICLDQPVRIYHRHPDAARETRPVPPTRALRQNIYADCIADRSSSPTQRLAASALRRLPPRRPATA